MAENNSEVRIPELGMAAVSFACFLVIVSLPSTSPELYKAVEYFAVSIPIVVAGAFIAIMREGAVPGWPKAVLRVLRLACALVGDVGCGIGIYWVFAHVSPVSSKRFLNTVLLCWLGVGLIQMAVNAIGYKYRHSSRKS